MKENSTLREEGRLRQFPKKRENKKERLLFLKKHRFQSFPSRLAWNTSTVFTMYEDRARIKSRRRQSRINISFLIETGLTRGSITQAFVCSSFVPRFTCAPRNQSLIKKNGEILSSIFFLEIFIPNNDPSFLQKTEKKGIWFDRFLELLYINLNSSCFLFKKKIQNQQRLSNAPKSYENYHIIYSSIRLQFSINIKSQEFTIHSKREIVDTRSWKFDLTDVHLSYYHIQISILEYYKIKLSKKMHHRFWETF